MSRKHKSSGHHEEPSEAWLIPYADILTLLLALFIVLYAASTVDEEKYEAIMQAFQGVFNANRPSPVEGEVLGSGEIEFPTINLEDIPYLIPTTEEATAEPGEEETEPTDEGGLDIDLMGIYNSILSYVDDKNLHESVGVSIVAESVLITLSNDIWFLPGSARISEEMRSMAATMSHMFEEIQNANDKPLRVVITGHTDTVPMNNAEFKSNWHLSVFRAVNFMEVLIETSKLDPRIFSARGHGEYSPIDTNETEEGRKHNRRVEVQVLYSTDFYEGEEHSGGETAESTEIPASVEGTS